MPMRTILGAAIALALAVGGAAKAQPVLPPTWTADARTGCKVWNPAPAANETVSWSGACTDGFASGPGVTEWIVDGASVERTEGTRAAGHLQGRGIQVSAEGDRFEGEWKDDRKNGHGIFTGSDGLTYDGGFRNDRFDGFGILDDSHGYRYVGEWKAGRRHGMGTAVFPDGSRYAGRWVDNQPVDRTTAL